MCSSSKNTSDIVLRSESKLASGHFTAAACGNPGFARHVCVPTLGAQWTEDSIDTAAADECGCDACEVSVARVQIDVGGAALLREHDEVVEAIAVQVSEAGVGDAVRGDAGRPARDRLPTAAASTVLIDARFG